MLSNTISWALIITVWQLGSAVNVANITLNYHFNFESRIKERSKIPGDILEKKSRSQKSHKATKWKKPSRSQKSHEAKKATKPKMQHLFFTEFLVGIVKLLIFLYIHTWCSNYMNIFFSKKPGICTQIIIIVY